MNSPKVGLLPCYIALYDQALPELASQQEPFLRRSADLFATLGCTVDTAPICRTRTDFAAALARFAAAGVEVIVVLHLAYSPSLEAAELLAASPLPVILLGTTPDVAFGHGVDPQRLLYNHGIHGLQDLACVLRRLGKPYRVIAGHPTDPAFPRRCAEVIRAATAARALRGMRVLRLGGEFPGMGDFAAGDDALRAGLGLTVENGDPADLAVDVAAVTTAALADEAEADRAQFRVECDAAVHTRSNRVGLGLRARLAAGGFGAFSLNFLSFRDAAGPVDTVPFLECSKAMARGIGYAGEGDVLTAALVGALARGFGPTTFAEIFCPDWAGQSLFLSHMGEFNPALAAARPLLYEKEYTFSPARNPAVLACAPRPGPGTWVNLAPGPAGTFRLIWCPVEIREDGTHPGIERWVRAWIRPPVPVATFLECFSQAGATHHSALLPGDHAAAMADFAAFLGLEHFPLP